MALLALAFLAGAVWACGPQFPWSMLRDEEAGVSFKPAASFSAEVRDILRAPHPTIRAQLPMERQSVFDHIAEVVRACEDRAAVERYAEARRGLATMRRDQMWAIERGEGNVVPALNPALPDEIPAPYRLYLQGLIHHHQGNAQLAERAWEEVLALPEPDRCVRSAWATYMLGRSRLDADPAGTIVMMQQVRKLAAAGANDSLGLATASLGWEALAHLRSGRPIEAIKLYAEQHSAGDPTAIPSLRRAIAALRDAGDAALLQRAAADPLVRRLVTSHVLEAGQGYRFGDGRARTSDAWLAALDAMTAAPLPDADRIAWAMYQSARFDEAERWLRHAEPTSTITLWIRAKLQLRNGDLDGAAETLTLALQHTPRNLEWEWAPGASIPDELMRPAERLAGELATIRVSQQRFDDALTLFIAGNWPIDAAYVAERVMGIDELQDFVDTSPRPMPAHWIDPADILARRLARAGRYLEAARYAAPQVADHLRALDEQLRVGRDVDRPLPERAEALRTAARLMRHQGLEMLGTTLEPDWAIYGGNFENAPVQDERGPVTLIAPASALELQRVASSGAANDHRWHYRYLAADLAWEASYLMPNQTEALANWLIEAGMWLAPRDPQAANRFYKALVIRAGATPLGQRAARLRWFPPRR
jgi:tetratricopeptide (TPR) repeat protein